MKKVLIVAVLFTLACEIAPIQAKSPGDYKGYPIVNVQINGNDLRHEVPAVNIDGTTMVPIRVVSENMGGKVVWDSNKYMAIITGSLSNQDKVVEKKNDLEYIRMKRINLLAESVANLDRELQIAKEYRDIRSNGQLLDLFRKKSVLVVRDKIKNFTNDLSDNSKDTLVSQVIWESLSSLNECVQYYEYAANQLDQYYIKSEKLYLEQYIEFISLAHRRIMDTRELIQEQINCKEF